MGILVIVVYIITSIIVLHAFDDGALKNEFYSLTFMHRAGMHEIADMHTNII